MFRHILLGLALALAVATVAVTVGGRIGAQPSHSATAHTIAATGGVGD